jgi:DNA-binding CsgD family transcriptional regulator
MTTVVVFRPKHGAVLEIIVVFRWHVLCTTPGMSRSTAKQTPPEARSEALRVVPTMPPAARTLPANQLLRAAARQLDRSPDILRHRDADRVIRLWDGLVRGRCTLVDWFDADGRRFIIAKLNPQKVGVPRGLTVREREVALSAALGESSKSTGYQLGISPSRVSALLKAAMRKLGVRSKAQLVVMVHVLNGQHCGSRSSLPRGSTHNG